MNAVDIDTRAHRLFEDYGARAMIIAGQWARAAERKQDDEQARIWRRIETVFSEMRS